MADVMRCVPRIGQKRTILNFKPYKKDGRNGGDRIGAAFERGHLLALGGWDARNRRVSVEAFNDPNGTTVTGISGIRLEVPDASGVLREAAPLSLLGKIAIQAREGQEWEIVSARSIGGIIRRHDDRDFAYWLDKVRGTFKEWKLNLALDPLGNISLENPSQNAEEIKRDGELLALYLRDRFDIRVYFVSYSPEAGFVLGRPKIGAVEIEEYYKICPDARPIVRSRVVVTFDGGSEDLPIGEW